jgi:hypothetical protein
MFIVGIAMLIKYGQVDGKAIEDGIGFIVALVGYILFVNLGIEKPKDTP